MKYINKYIEENKDRFLDELIELLKIPSISADPHYKNAVLICAEAVADSLKIAGADNVEICPTAGYPIVYADMIIDKNFKVYLVLDTDTLETVLIRIDNNKNKIVFVFSVACINSCST